MDGSISTGLSGVVAWPSPPGLVQWRKETIPPLWDGKTAAREDERAEVEVKAEWRFDSLNLILDLDLHNTGGPNFLTVSIVLSTHT